MTQLSSLWAVLTGGFVAGLLDIIFAISFAGYSGVPPVRLLQTVASGLFGDAAFARSNGYISAMDNQWSEGRGNQ